MALKQVDNRIIALKRDINKLKDILVEYGTYEVGTKRCCSLQQIGIIYWNQVGNYSREIVKPLVKLLNHDYGK